MKAEIIRLLKDENGYVSGQELCERLGVSRTAVWKVIKRLQSEGYKIEAVRNKGYHLIETGNAMTEAEIKSCLGPGILGQEVVYYQETDSTNTRAKYLAEEGAGEGTLIVAESQRTGKGRRGKSWSSPPGASVYMSLVLRPDITPVQASMLTLVTALGVSEGIRSLAGVTPQIKWPNDLVLDGKKLCGILTEMSTELEIIHYVVVGIGINVNTEKFPPELTATATSLWLETGRRLSRASLIGAVVGSLEQYYTKFLSVKDLSILKEDYESRLANAERPVTVLDPAGAYRGICRGIDRQGALLVEREDGTLCRVLSGEVSVRGIYGYV